MREYKINITIKDDATIAIDANGFVGDACIKEVEKIMEEVAPIGEVKKKPEFYKNVSKKTYRTTSVGGR